MMKFIKLYPRVYINVNILDKWMIPLIKDIQGLDTISFLPLSVGWYVVILLSFIPLFLLLKLIIFWRQHPKNSWHNSAYKELKALKKQLPKMDDKEALDQFSELLRRIAIARCGREQCASLYGQRWLDWLEVNDPKKFSWTTKGKVLINQLYSNQQDEIDKALLLPLISATFVWVKANYRGQHV